MGRRASWYGNGHGEARQHGASGYWAHDQGLQGPHALEGQVADRILKIGREDKEECMVAVGEILSK